MKTIILLTFFLASCTGRYISSADMELYAKNGVAQVQSAECRVVAPDGIEVYLWNDRVGAWELILLEQPNK